LYKSFENPTEFMPETHLLKWDCESEEEISELPSLPSLLKASLGSGGDGIYFVNTRSEILQVIKDHARKALASEGFIQSLIKMYGDVPDWNLQRYVRSLRIRNDTRRTQFRVYAVSCNNRIFVYKKGEVRLPEWNIDLDNAISSNISLREELSEDNHNISGEARPYNDERNKTLTERHTVEEVEEIRQLNPILIEHSILALQALRPTIEKSRTSNESNAPLSPLTDAATVDSLDNPSTHKIAERIFIPMAIVGIDLIIDRETLRPLIVEFNNNPAMAKKASNMSENYKAHLISFVVALFKLGISNGNAADDFELVF
jgi:hypothetical protein